MICKSCTIWLISLYQYLQTSHVVLLSLYFEWWIGLGETICTFRQDFMNKIGACPIRLHFGPFFGKLLAILYQHKSSNFILFSVFAVYLVIIDLLPPCAFIMFQSFLPHMDRCLNMSNKLDYYLLYIGIKYLDVNSLNAKCIYAYKMRIICLTIHAVLCVIAC